jgi:hypothetical protein
MEGTETRVNAQAEGYEYMVSYTTKCKQAGRLENVLGWCRLCRDADGVGTIVTQDTDVGCRASMWRHRH